MTTPNPPPNHAAGCYYVNIASGTIQRQCNPVAAIALGQIGFVGVGGNPADGTNAFPTFAAAQAFANSSTASGGINTAINDVTGWTNAVGQFFSFITSRQTLVRFAEGILGLVLIWVGFNALLDKELLPYATQVGKILK